MLEKVRCMAQNKPKMITKPTGLIYVFTGDGKGKTSASLGVAIRALSAGFKVAIVQWYKQSSWGISEHTIETLLNTKTKPKFHIYPLGVGFCFPTSKKAPHKQAAQAALLKANEIMSQVDVLILDEINNAIHDKLINLKDVKELINNRGKTHLILTGRNIHPDIIEIADLVTEMKPIKHPFNQGKLAVKGLDF